MNVWDNGEFTFFKFPGNRDVPAIYMVDADGKESIVNRNTTGAANDVVVVQKINPKFYLRLETKASPCSMKRSTLRRPQQLGYVVAQCRARFEGDAQ